MESLAFLTILACATSLRKSRAEFRRIYLYWRSRNLCGRSISVCHVRGRAGRKSEKRDPRPEYIRFQKSILNLAVQPRLQDLLKSDLRICRRLRCVAATQGIGGAIPRRGSGDRSRSRKRNAARDALPQRCCTTREYSNSWYRRH